MIIAVDAAGGDYAPQEIVKGAVEAASEKGIKIVLLGDKQALDILLAQAGGSANIAIVGVEQTITCDEHPVQAVRSKPDSAIVRGIQMVRKSEASAFVSAGNTGAVLAAAFLHLDKLHGIERPAICVVVPVSTCGKPFLLLDAGANADCQPRFLVQFALLGSAFAHLFLGIESPRIGLLNNGGEEVKGSGLTRETHQLLKKTGLNFTGNIEGQDILKGKADVLVTDGFTGNVLLKTIEGFADVLQTLVASGSRENVSARGDKSSGVENSGFTSLMKSMDFNEYGGSCLLGLKGNVIICHGRSKSRAIKHAIIFAQQTAASGMVETITKEFSMGNT